MYKIKENKGTSFNKNYGYIADKYIIDTKINNNKDVLNAKTLIDTGANCSCISRDIVNKLHLVPIDVVTISTPSNQTIVNVYVLNIEINNEAIIEDVRVCDSNIGNQGLDLLLGTDIIQMGDLMIKNFNNETVLSFRLPTSNSLFV